MAQRGRPAKAETTETSSREDSRESRGSRGSSRGSSQHGGRGESKEYTQVSKLFESKFKEQKYTGKVQKEKLEALVERLQTILEDNEAAQFHIDLNGKWGPYMSVTNADEYQARSGGSRGGYSRGSSRSDSGSKNSGRSENKDWDNDSDWEK